MRFNFDIANNSLTGSIPSEIFSIETLEALGLSQNNLHGSISSEIGKATGLIILELGRNMLDGVLPSEIYNLSRLELLNVRANDLRGSIPPSILELTTLELTNIADSGLDVEQIPATACDASPQRVIVARCIESMHGNDTLLPCIRCSQSTTASINGK